MRELLIAYLAIVLGILTVCTGIRQEEGVRLRHMLVAAFAWPFFAPVLALRAWMAR